MTRLKILCCCGAGMGTCMLLKGKVDRALTQLGWSANISCESVAIGKTIFKNYDVVITNHNLVSNFEMSDGCKTVLIGLENVMSIPEIKSKLEANKARFEG